MPNPSEPNEDHTPSSEDPTEPSRQSADAPTEKVTLSSEHEPATEVFGLPTEPGQATPQGDERRFTAPSSFDGSTQKIDTPPDPETEVFAPPPGDPNKPVAPQVIPPRDDAARPQAPATARRSWGWVIAVVLVIAALVAIAILGTVLLTRDSASAGSQEDRVRETIQKFDSAIQRGDLATLRSITCGTTRDNYVNYNEKAWAETHERVAAAKQYPVVASIDQVIVNDDHAEANVTTFMAFAPQTRSTRSFDLQFRDDEWKICQSPAF
ncbi:Rv0361 family membrane protein [Mycolicibacterium smegmatis]|jgi:hypothetical protein|uniref:DUF4878 domain-containing protein n=3 Tax=Mycolicibacterium smegmatis TaxID=1772 RepID=I7FWX6_MYCS2|nr:hypothetical protein [Mycolicibacterium smegmatis]ABK75743.1 conserved hypothetical protein [Mycolicibacterium smegmatis MC2 155]AFP37217.1 hypothetical protein MSMEI_0737 [Mycolicibacterium smegmatis MC2 155]AIU06017.1 membrane protein [Mycolicibacterium smegmatis MC2 155]AIU12642.1 membrane protein [Mycolicibacterium smegmatis]AIU19266.1 membrane protein [Mycolicibacterium smegmatis]